MSALRGSFVVLIRSGLPRSDFRSDQTGPSVRRLVRSHRTVGLLGSETPAVGDDSVGVRGAGGPKQGSPESSLTRPPLGSAHLRLWRGEKASRGNGLLIVKRPSPRGEGGPTCRTR
jgi:hypothetical protein